MQNVLALHMEELEVMEAPVVWWVVVVVAATVVTATYVGTGLLVLT